MSIIQRQDPFIRSATALLDEAERQISPVDLMRLSATRRRAIDSTQKRALWPLVGGALAVASLVGFMVLTTSAPELERGALPPARHLELLASTEGIEFYEELAFIEWLEKSRYAHH